jgi:hypothetical protein
MANDAEGEQVGERVSLLVPLYTELPKRYDVMYVKVTAVFTLAYAATLASVVIALAGVAPLAAPVWAIVGFIATLPIAGLLTAERFEVLSEARPRTKVVLGLFELLVHLSNGAAAAIALGIYRRVASVLFSKITGGIKTGASSGAVLTRPGSVIPERLTTLRAGRLNLARFVQARLRAVDFNAGSITGRIVTKFLIADGANTRFQCFHVGIPSDMNMTKLYLFYKEKQQCQA